MQTADDLVNAGAGGLGLGDGDLLHRVLQLHPGGFQLLDQVGPVEQLERRDALAAQPVLQQPSDALARVDGIEVSRAGAERGGLHRIRLALGLLLGALGQDGDRDEFPGLQVHGLLGDSHRCETPALDQLVGRLDRALAIFGGAFEIERCAA